MTEEEKKAGKTLDPENLSEEELENIVGGGGGPLSPATKAHGRKLAKAYGEHLRNGGTVEEWVVIRETIPFVSGKPGRAKS